MSHKLDRSTVKSMLKNQAQTRRIVEEIEKEFEEPDYTQEKDCTVTMITPMFAPDPNPDNSKALIPVKSDKKSHRKTDTKSKHEKREKREKTDKKTKKEKTTTHRTKKTEKPIGNGDTIKAVKDKVAAVIGATVEKSPEKGKDQPKVRKERPPERMNKVEFGLGSKKDHPFASRIEGNQSIHANGHAGRTLTLKRGVKYQVKFLGKEGSGYELILTKDPVGGKGANCISGTKPIVIGTSYVIQLNEAPDLIYYQDSSRQFLGGIIKMEGK